MPRPPWGVRLGLAVGASLAVGVPAAGGPDAVGAISVSGSLWVTSAANGLELCDPGSGVPGITCAPVGSENRLAPAWLRTSMRRARSPKPGSTSKTFL